MRIINIIDTFDKVNYGIWNAAIATAQTLKKEYNISSELWYPDNPYKTIINDAELVPISDLSVNNINILIKKRDLKPDNSIIVTHGCWQFPTKWGAQFKKKGFRWIYVPHGMLEPWSMKQKAIKKKIYFKLIEHRLSKNADFIRAVGTPELLNLQKTYNKTILIPNGIETSTSGTYLPVWKNNDTLNYLFMARLHHKKGIMPLVNAWINSPQSNNVKHHLYIAGPDDGELEKLQKQIQSSLCTNITYLGPVYGNEKQELINKCNIYLLPSFSEGFPTSVLEAMSNGLLAVITDGCNFPEAFDNNVAIKTSPDESDISKTLKYIFDTPVNKLYEISHKGADFVNQNYSIEVIAKQQAELYNKLIS